MAFCQLLLRQCPRATTYQPRAGSGGSAAPDSDDGLPGGASGHPGSIPRCSCRFAAGSSAAAAHACLATAGAPCRKKKMKEKFGKSDPRPHGSTENLALGPRKNWPQTPGLTPRGFGTRTFRKLQWCHVGSLPGAISMLPAPRREASTCRHPCTHREEPGYQQLLGLGIF